LQQGGERGKAEADRVAELTQEVLPQVGGDGFGSAGEVDLEAEHLDGALEAVDPVLGRGRQAWGLRLQRADLVHDQRDDQQDQTGQSRNDDDEDQSDG
jgi:hypothetical protein